jgi:hypothetical protein
MSAEMIRKRRNTRIPGNGVGLGLNRQGAVYVLDAGEQCLPPRK